VDATTCSAAYIALPSTYSYKEKTCHAGCYYIRLSFHIGIQDVKIALPMCALPEPPSDEESLETECRDDGGSQSSEGKFASLFLSRLKQSNEVRILLDSRGLVSTFESSVLIGGRSATKLLISSYILQCKPLHTTENT
jgi:hypothetical protein